MIIKSNDIILVKLVHKEDKNHFREELLIGDYYQGKSISQAIDEELRMDLNAYFIKDISVYDKYDINNTEDISIRIYRSL